MLAGALDVPARVQIPVALDGHRIVSPQQTSKRILRGEAFKIHRAGPTNSRSRHRISVGRISAGQHARFSGEERTSLLGLSSGRGCIYLRVARLYSMDNPR